MSPPRVARSLRPPPRRPDRHGRHREPTMNQSATSSDRSYALPPLGDHPSTEGQGTTPGSFALKGRVGTPYAYSSPDTPGMPGVSELTAMDFAGSRDHEGRTQLEAART